MTAQVCERIKIGSRMYELCTEPLEPLLQSMKPVPTWPGLASCCWRGYVGTWRIGRGKLWLTAIESFANFGGRGMQGSGTLMPGGTDEVGAGPPNLFPDRQLPVEAIWFTGELRCVRGEIVEYVHGGYASTWEQEWTLPIRAGQVVGALRPLSTDRRIDLL